jgi:uncharacterized protein YabN with tetrapyrrole methylase and pyrophosphatase domain
MHSFDKLMEVARRLNEPDGCPWDVKQTFFSLQPYLLEEVHEVIEAVDGQDPQKILEELGDLFYTVIFFCKVAEREGKFTTEQMIDHVREKLIFRHPHVFGDKKAETSEEVIKNWEPRKLEEKAHQTRKSALDGIPPALPLLLKAQKIVGKILRKHPAFFSALEQAPKNDEEEISQELFQVLRKAHAKEIDVESVLRRATQECEKRFREYEEKV